MDPINYHLVHVAHFETYTTDKWAEDAILRMETVAMGHKEPVYWHLYACCNDLDLKNGIPEFAERWPKGILDYFTGVYFYTPQGVMHVHKIGVAHANLQFSDYFSVLGAVNKAKLLSWVHIA